MDRRFDRCASVVFEREGRLYYFRLYLFVRTCTRAESSEFTNCDTVSFSSSKNPRLRNLDHHTLTPFCKIFTSRYRIVRSRSRNTMDYFVREKESINACTHVVHKRMGISSRNGGFFLKQTSENIFDLRKIRTISSFFNFELILVATSIHRF